MQARDLRVAIVSDAEPGRNGVGTYYLDLAEHLAPAVDHVAFCGPGVDNGEVPWWLRMRLPGDPKQRLELPSPRALRRYFGALRPHAVIAATPGPYGLLGARYAGALGAQRIAGLHTDFDALSQLYWGRRWVGRMNRWGLVAAHKALFRRSDWVVANAPHMIELARSVGCRRTCLLGTQLPRPFLAEPTLASSGGVGHVLFVGRLAAEKRVEAVLEAACERPGIRFTLMGDGPLRTTVEAASARYPNVDYRGWCGRDAVRREIDAADLLVLPSEVEAFGTVALEALARERLAIVSDQCGIAAWPELAQGLVTLGTGEGLTHALDRVAALGAAERARRARDARAAVVAMNEATRADWLHLLAGSAVSSAPAAA